MTVARGNAAARLVGDELYVVGGSSGNTLHTSVERASFTAGSMTLGAFANVGNLGTARQRLSLAVASAATAPASFSSTNPDNRQDVYLLAVGGDQGGAPLGSIEVARVRTSAGPVAAPFTFVADNHNAASTHGGWAEVVANYLFQAGSTGGASFAFHSGPVCGQGSNPVQCTAPSSFSGSFNSTSLAYQQGGPRYLGGVTLFRAFVYAAGGFPNDAGGTPTPTIERIIY
jgi:hypothetical protein